MILAEPRHEPKVRQGVTTELIGVDGNAYAPFRTREDLAAFVELNARPRRPARHRTTTGRPSASYLARFDGGVSVNIAYLVGNSALRIAALGWDDVAGRRADAIDRRCAAMLREAMEEGAFGLSSGPRLPAGRLRHDRGARRARPAEAAKLGGFYHTHVRYPLGDRFLDPFREAIEIGRRGGAPAHITHFYHRRDVPGPARSRCSAWSTTPAPRASTSRSTPIRTSGRARGC